MAKVKTHVRVRKDFPTDAGLKGKLEKLLLSKPAKKSDLKVMTATFIKTSRQ